MGWFVVRLHIIEGMAIKIPENFNWIAQDANGNYWAFEVEPNQHSSGWYENEIGESKFLIAGQANPQWQNSLQSIAVKH